MLHHSTNTELEVLRFSQIYKRCPKFLLVAGMGSVASVAGNHDSMGLNHRLPGAWDGATSDGSIDSYVSDSGNHSTPREDDPQSDAPPTTSTHGSRSIIPGMPADHGDLTRSGHSDSPGHSILLLPSLRQAPRSASTCGQSSSLIPRPSIPFVLHQTPSSTSTGRHTKSNGTEFSNPGPDSEKSHLPPAPTASMAPSPLFERFFDPSSAEPNTSAPTGYPTCRSETHFHAPDFERSIYPEEMSAVDDNTRAPPLLTRDLFAAGDDAALHYEDVRMQCLPQESWPTKPNPFSSLSAQELEKCFAAAVDAKNALYLRRSAVAADIGDVLERLLPKLSLLEKDVAMLETAFQDMRFIIEACSNQSLHLDLFSLEFSRGSLPSHRPSVMERYGSLFAAVEEAVDQKDSAQQMTRAFMEDPSCLKERRLPYLSKSRR